MGGQYRGMKRTKTKLEISCPIHFLEIFPLIELNLITACKPWDQVRACHIITYLIGRSSLKITILDGQAIVLMASIMFCFLREASNLAGYIYQLIKHKYLRGASNIMAKSLPKIMEMPFT